MKNILFLFISILLSLPVFSQYTVRDISIDTTIHFFGKSVAIPKTYRYNGEKKEIVFPSGAVRWKLYSNEREAEQQGKIEYEKIKSRIRKSGILLVEDRDDIVFRGEKVSANRIRYGTTMVVTGCLFGGPYPEYGVVSDNYSFCVPVDDKFLFMDINFEEERHFDTVYVSLPAFIEENFMRQADKTLLIEPHVVDTIEVKKKKRYLLWHYYDKHTITNGLSLGFSRISSANNVISNGARVEVIGSSLITTVFSLYPYYIITRKEIDEAYWFDSPPSCRQILGHIRLINEIEGEYPIILDFNGRLMDGMHRVMRALLRKEQYIKAVQFDNEIAPDFIGVDENDLTY